MPAAEKLIGRFAFEKFVKGATNITVSIVSEALKTREFNTVITQKWHRDLLAYQLIARYEPATLGMLASLFENGETELAIGHALDALKKMRAADPTLFWPSKIDAPETRRWMKRGFDGRSQDEIWGLVDRADECERWSLRHECARRLSEAHDVEAIRNELRRDANAGHEHVQRAIAQTPGGQISGYNGNTPAEDVA